MTPSQVLDCLRANAGTRLADLPASSGIYALRDHNRSIRYVGIAHTEGFRTRINNKHTTGSEDRSHKFSCAYNVGRMWRDRHSDHGPDAKIAKDLRTAFIRKHCSASFVPIEGYQNKHELELLEREVLALADPDETVWNRPFICAEEPSQLVDQLILERRYTSVELAALERQNVRFKEKK